MDPTTIHNSIAKKGLAEKQSCENKNYLHAKYKTVYMYEGPIIQEDIPGIWSFNN